MTIETTAARRALPHRKHVGFTVHDDGAAQPLMPQTNPWGHTLGPRLLADDTGIPVAAFPRSVVTSVPFPARPHGWGPGRWPGVSPAALWMPWLWLPDRLARPADGEPVHVWHTRVALELGLSGLFDQEAGWVDVARSFAGVGVDDEDDLGRAARWLDGAPDTDLDTVAEQLASQWLPDGPGERGWSAAGAELLAAGTGTGGVGALWVAGAGALCAAVDAMFDDPGADPRWVAVLGRDIPVWGTDEDGQWGGMCRDAEAGDTASYRARADGLRPLLRAWADRGGQAARMVADELDAAFGDSGSLLDGGV